MGGGMDNDGQRRFGRGERTFDEQRMFREKFLKSCGWSQWYSDDYWVHPKTVLDPKQQDHTNYGMSLDDAYKFETESLPPFKPMGLPALSMQEHAILVKEKEEAKQKMEQLQLTGDPAMDAILRDCIKILQVKGHDYTVGSTDRLANFRKVAEFTGMTKEQVLGTYFYKHVAGIFSYIKSGGQSESEPIEGRICDVINYMLLFAHMVAENKENDRQKQIALSQIPG